MKHIVIRSMNLKFYSSSRSLFRYSRVFSLLCFFAPLRLMSNKIIVFQFPLSLICIAKVSVKTRYYHLVIVSVGSD